MRISDSMLDAGRWWRVEGGRALRTWVRVMNVWRAVGFGGWEVVMRLWREVRCVSRVVSWLGEIRDELSAKR